MILRRFMKHVTEQNWFAVGLDVIVVIVGIYLGLQVQEWSNIRAERQEEQAYLINLESDLTTSVELANTDLELSHRTVSSLTYILDAVFEPQAEVPQDKLDKAVFYGLYNVLQMEVQLNTLDEMISSGKLALLRNNQLRNRLVGLSRKIEAIRYEERNIYDILVGHIDTSLVERYNAINYIRFEGTIHNDYIDKKYLVPQAADDLLPLLDNKKIINAVYYRISMQAFKIAQLEELINDYQEILQMIRQ